MILSGELKHGDRLPPERKLADTMGISKTIIHKGIWELIRMGFLDARLYLECLAIEELAAWHDPEHIKKPEALQENVRKNTFLLGRFSTVLFTYRKSLVSLSGNCITPLIMNAFFTASNSAWADYWLTTYYFFF